MYIYIQLYVHVQVLQDTRAEASRLTIQCDELAHINQTLSSNIKHTNYKTDNFDTVKRYIVQLCLHV